jgi:hypothetical protein
MGISLAGRRAARRGASARRVQLPRKISRRRSTRSSASSSGGQLDSEHETSPRPGSDRNPAGNRCPSARDRPSVPRPADSYVPPASAAGKDHTGLGRPETGSIWRHSARHCVSPHAVRAESHGPPVAHHRHSGSQLRISLPSRASAASVAVRLRVPVGTAEDVGVEMTVTRNPLHGSRTCGITASGSCLG